MYTPFSAVTKTTTIGAVMDARQSFMARLAAQRAAQNAAHVAAPEPTLQFQFTAELVETTFATTTTAKVVYNAQQKMMEELRRRQQERIIIF